MIFETIIIVCDVVKEVIFENGGLDANELKKKGTAHQGEGTRENGITKVK